MKIALHGFGTYPIVFRHLIETARKSAPQIEWSVILPAPHHARLISEVVDESNILSLQDLQTRNIRKLDDTRDLRDYHGNIFSNIEAEKNAFKHRPSWEQLARAEEIYRLYKAFLQRVRPTHILIPQIEGYEGRMLPNLAHELGITAMIPFPGRNLGGTFFCPDTGETIPPYRDASPARIKQAEEFISRFRSKGVPATGPATMPADKDEILASGDRPLPARAMAFAQRSLGRPDLFEAEYLRISVLNNLPWLRDGLWWLNRKRAENQFDIAGIDQLPPRFIYYPLQVTPESSINTPAPYFVDQLRAIDAIRFAIPSDHLLVVKEHPSAIATRSPSFVRALRRRAGVEVIYYRADSRALVERAALTISVTGTATLEAFMLGRPALTLGPTLIAEYLGGVCSIEQLSTRIKQKLDQPISDEKVVRAIAEIYSTLYDFVLRPPGLPGEPALRRGNIERMLAAILDHIARSASPGQGAPS